MAVSFSDILKSTGASGQRKGLEPYGGRIVDLEAFKLDLKGKETDKNGMPKERKQSLTAMVADQGRVVDKDGNVSVTSVMHPRRARMPVRYMRRFLEAMERHEGPEPFAVRGVLIVVGDHGATLAEPPKPKVETNGTARRPGRPRKVQPTEQPQGDQPQG